MNIKLITYLLFIFFASKAYSQSVSQEIIEQYPASITARLYDVMSTVQLDINKQKIIADILIKEDSSIVAAIKNGKPKQEIDSIHSQSAIKFQALLNKIELGQYLGSFKDEVYTLAKAMAIATRKSFGGDSIMEAGILKVYFRKYMEIERLKKLYKNTPSYFAYLELVASHYDSIVSHVTNAFQQDKYFAERILQLDSIKPLREGIKKKMKARFNLLCKTGGNSKSYADSFNQVLHLYIKDTDYYGVLYKKEIAARAFNNSKQSTLSLSKTYKLPKRCFETLDSILYAREKMLATLYYTFQSITPAKDSLENSTVAYYDSLVNHMLYREGVNTPNSLFFSVIKYRDMLKLTNTKVDSLVDMGFKFEALCKLKLKQNDISFYRPAAEREQVKAIITEDKLYELTRFFNRDKARKNTISDWSEIKRFGLAEPEDSIKVTAQLFQYNLSKLTIIDYYKYNDTGKWKAFSALEDTRAFRIRQLQGAWKMEAAEKRKKQQKEHDNGDTSTEANNTTSPSTESTKKNYRGSYQW